MRSLINSVFSLLFLIGCGDNYISSGKDGELFDIKNQSICKIIDSYCLPLQGDIYFSDSKCENALVGNTKDGSAAKFVSTYYDDYFIFYELGFMKYVDEDEVLYKKEVINNRYTCVVSTDSNKKMYREIISKSKNGNRFKL